MKPTHILVAHNSYRLAGGEDVVVGTEVDLLRSAGHHVTLFSRTNEEIHALGPFGTLKLGMRASWSQETYRNLTALLQQQRIELAHFHNIFPLMSPAAYYACAQLGIPVVQTLHNYRLICPAGTLYRDGSICEECPRRGLWRAVSHGCYRHSRPATTAVAAMVGIHRLFATWTTQIDCYIALSEFARRKYVEAGLPAHKIRVRPNCVHPDPGERENAGDHALFVGRLSVEKGIRTLLAAYESRSLSVPLCIVGDGPLSGEVAQRCAALPRGLVRAMGRLSADRTLAEMKRARLLIFPSESYEALPMTLIEAHACGVPIVASRMGVMNEIIHDGETGVLFDPGSAGDLARAVDWACRHPAALAAMGRRARREYERKYDATRGYHDLIRIYHDVLAARKRAA